jgi:5,10-methylenetetrahydromethanopterin reductase
MDVSCAFATGLHTPEHIVLGERLGYRRAWCFDSPALYADVWMTLALAAARTSVIGLGPGVLIPHLRHVMTNAAAIATLAAAAPGRVSVAVGSGFTGRLAMGQRPMSWKSVRAYILALRALLRGEEVEWGGSTIKMLHLEGFAPPRPIEVPILAGVSGPKGLAVAEEVADGAIGATGTRPSGQGRLRWIAQMTNGTVLDEGETLQSERVLAAAGHGAALAYHAAYERGQVESLPRGAEFARRGESIPAGRRHLALHEGHLVTLNALDREFVTPEFLARLGRAVGVEAWRQRLADIEGAGATELIYQPAGPDIPRELRSFAEMAGLRSR